jgi:succinate-semialdehyde dehydrogenase/glutarate-semialdehyde dehydrogenase
MSGFSTINPKNAQEIRRYEYLAPEQIEAALVASSRAFQHWSRAPITTRAEALRKLAQLLIQKKEALAELVTDEMGKPILQAEAELEKCATACLYYAEHAASMLADDVVSTGHAKSYVAYQALGPILAIMPWNFPFWQVIRCAAPAIAAGNTVLLKHADNSAGVALILAELWREAGLPEGVFTTLFVDHKGIEPVIADQRIRAVSLTGSERAGSSVAALAGKYLKKTVLELGGSDPYIVLRDADVMQAAKICAQSRFINNGQSCVAAKRFIVDELVYDSFLEAFLQQARARRVGDPRDKAHDIGPLAKLSIVEAIDRQVKASVSLGARVLLGGQRVDGPGYFYPPTILVNVNPEMPVFHEEVFGPVAPIISAKNERQALALAANTNFGLGCAIFSSDCERAEYLARSEIAAGLVAVNDMVVSDPRLPFGGIGNSGYGKELSLHGLREFVNAKSITVR